METWKTYSKPRRAACNVLMSGDRDLYLILGVGVEVRLDLGGNKG